MIKRRSFYMLASSCRKPASPEVVLRRRESSETATLNETNHNHDDRDDQKDVNESAHRVRTHQPQKLLNYASAQCVRRVR